MKICTGYRCGGEALTSVPASMPRLASCTPELETLPGWSRPTAGLRRFDELPAEAVRYIERVEELTGVPVAVVSTGSDRHDTIIRDDSVVGRWLALRAGGGDGHAAAADRAWSMRIAPPDVSRSAPGWVAGQFVEVLPSGLVTMLRFGTCPL